MSVSKRREREGEEEEGLPICIIIADASELWTARRVAGHFTTSVRHEQR